MADDVIPGQEPTPGAGQEPNPTPDPSPAPEPTPAGQEPKDAPERYDAEYVKELRKSEAESRRKAKDAEARLKAIEDAQLSDQERKERELTEAKAEVERYRAERQSLLVRHAVEREAGKLGFADPEDAARFVDLAAVPVDDDGQPQGLARLLKDVLTAKPYLKGTPAPGGVPGTPKPANGDLSDADRRKQAVGIKQLW